MKFLDLMQGSEEWLAIRKQYATASDMPCIMGIPGAFKSRKAVLRGKLYGEKPPTDFEKRMFARGHEVEAELRSYAEDYLCLNLKSVVVVDNRRGILASIDNIDLKTRVIVEIKNSVSEKKLRLAREGRIWQPYKVQLWTQMLVTKAPFGFLFMRDDRTGEVHVSSIEPDKKIYRQISKAAREFVKELNNVRT